MPKYPNDPQLRLTFQTYTGMKRRCYDPRHKTYEDYGARGVRVYFDWLGVGGFRQFIADAGLRPGREYQLDRKDSSRGYEPGNVQWVEAKINLGRPSREKHCCRMKEIKAVGPDGREHALPLHAWAELLGIKYRSLSRRLQRAGSDQTKRARIFATSRRSWS